VRTLEPGWLLRVKGFRVLEVQRPAPIRREAGPGLEIDGIEGVSVETLDSIAPEVGDDSRHACV